MVVVRRPTQARPRSRYKYTFLHHDTGNLRVYYRSTAGGLYCLQQDGGWGTSDVHFYVCSRDGEPSYEVAMPREGEVDIWQTP